MNPKSKAGILATAILMAATTPLVDTQIPERYLPRTNSRYVRKKTELTPKQKKARAKAKASRKARRKNRR